MLEIRGPSPPESVQQGSDRFFNFNHYMTVTTALILVPFSDKLTTHTTTLLMKDTFFLSS